MCKKVPAPPPLGDIAPPKKDQPPGIITVQNSSTPPPPLIFGRRLIPYIIVYIRENQNLNLFLVK